MSKNQLLPIMSAIVASASAIVATGETASAITLFNSSVTPIEGGTIFTYSIILDANESLGNSNDNFPFNASTIVFQDLVGVTDVSVMNPYQLEGFDPTSANLSVATTTSGEITINDFVTITANAFPSEVNATVTFNEFGFPASADFTLTGPGTPVPFEAETTTGVAALGLFMAGRTYWKRRQKNA